MLYAALGDSITFGYSASQDERSFVARVRRALARKGNVSLYTCAKPGWTSKQLLRAVRRTPECIWDEARVVTILIGGNDLLWAAPWLVESNPGHVMKVAGRLYDNLTEVVECVSRPTSTVILCTIYNPFPNSLLAAEYTNALNRSIRRVAKRHHLRIVDLDAVFQGREEALIDGYQRGQIRDIKLRGNPVHPNDTGHQRIAQALLSVYKRRSDQAHSKRLSKPGKPRPGLATRRHRMPTTT